MVVFLSKLAVYSMESASTMACGVMVSAIAIDPEKPEIVYVLTVTDDIYKSSNSGDSWSVVSKGISGINLVIDIENSQIIYAGRRKSIDGGKTWNSIWQTTVTTISKLMIDPNNTRILYSLITNGGVTRTKGGIYKSINGGESWIAIGDEKLGECTAFAIDINDTNVFYGYFVRKITDSFGRTKNIYGREYGATGEIFKSVDGGTTWTSSLPAYGIEALAVDPSNSAIIYALDMQHGLYRSLDGGKRWSRINQGLPERARFSVFAVDPLNPGTIYVGTSRGLFVNTDYYNSSWRDLGLYVDVRMLAINPQNPKNIYAVASDGDGIFKTADGGITWRHANKGLPEISCLRLSPPTWF